MSAPASAARRLLIQNLSLLIVATMCVVACLGYSGVFSGWGFLAQVIAAAIGASAAAFVSRRWQLLVGEAILVTVLGFLVVGTVVTQWVPGIASPADFATSLTRGWADLLSSQTPTSLNPRRAVVPFATAWVATALAQELDRRVRFPAIALAGVLVGLVATSLFSTEVRSLARIQGPILIGLAIVLALVHRYEQDRTGLSLAHSTTATRRRVLAPAAMLTAVMVTAGLVGPSLPLADANERFDLRDRQENPWDPLDSPSPLVTLKAQLKAGVESQVMFRVASDVPITRWSVAVMASYDGVVWQVADPVGDAAAQFVPVDEQLPVAASAAGTRSARADVEIVNFEGPWIPHGGDPTALALADAGEVRMNLSTRTLAHPPGLAAGDRYTVSTRLHPAVDDIGLARFQVDDRSTELQLLPAPVLNLAAESVEGVDFGGPQVVAIRELLTGQGFYDAGPNVPPGHSYARIAAFLDDPERVVGYEEQYAATAAVLSRLASIPTRVAVGYLVPDQAYVDGVADVLAEHAAAWIEVRVEGVGWVPVDVTPDRSRVPTEQEIGKVTRNVAVPNEPPPPPPPQQSEEDQLEEEDEEEDDDDEEDDEAEAERSLLRALLDRPGVVAGTVALSPLMVFALLALLAMVLKAWRTRRRRNAATARLQVAGAWAELVDRLEESGHSIAANATPAEIADRVAQSASVAEPEVRELAGLVSRSAFAPSEPSVDEVERAWFNAEQAAEAAAGSLGWFERLRMRVDPRPLLRRSPRGRSAEADS